MGKGQQTRLVKLLSEQVPERISLMIRWHGVMLTSDTQSKNPLSQGERAFS